jgi:hypothetical protein
MTPEERRKGRIKNTKSIIEIVAIALAGCWALLIFFRTEQPSLERRGTIESKLDWSPMQDNGYCLGIFTIKVKNIGNNAFEITSARSRVWMVPEPEPKANIERLDPEKFQSSKPDFDEVTEKGDLIMRYAPGVEVESALPPSIP